MCHIVYALNHKADTILITDDLLEADNYYQSFVDAEIDCIRREIPMSAAEVNEQMELT